MIVVPASGWFNTPLSPAEREALQLSGMVPISDSFMPTLDSLARYQVIYGGRGGGKSETVARKLIRWCDEWSYFRCIYSRKIADTIRESCFALLSKAIKEMGMEHKFTINKTTMAITHVNGNTFVAKGVDDPEKVKSTDEPNVLWCEEAPEFNEQDFITLDNSIRTGKGPNVTIITFNPVRDTSWVRRKFFHPEDSHAPHPDYVGDIFIFRSTYSDNNFIDRDAYYRNLLRNSSGNKNRIRVDVNGDWGVPENKNPWLYAFEPEKHVRKNLPFYPTFPIYLSFDFNRDPVTCSARQMSPQKGTRDSFIHTIKEFGGKIQLHDLCQQIRASFPASILFVTGDSSGRKGDVTYNSAHDSAYSLIRAHLNLAKAQMQPNTYNILHENSRLLMNAMYHNYPNLYISSDGCPNLIADCEMAEVDEKSNKPHALKKDRDQFKMDYFDGDRYFYQQYFQDFAKSAYFTLQSQPPPLRQIQAA